MTMLNELSVRPERGSNALRFVRWRGSYLDFASPRLVILVHGFNTSEEKARDSYLKFLRNLVGSSAGCRGAGSYGKVSGAFWAFYWPGDHSSRAVKTFKALDVYTERKGEAKTSGQSLGELIMQLPPTQEIMLVGHSMGCRVVLEALYYIAFERHKQRQGGAFVSAACLMAAAVGVGECDGAGAPFRRRDGEPRELVLYSEHDGVLGGHEVLLGLGKSVSGFKVAEWLNDSQVGPAVGATGEPVARWLDRPAGTNHPQDTGIGHTKYWAHKVSARLAGDFLAGVPAGEAAGRVGPEELTREQERREQAARADSTRELGNVRSLPWQNCWDPF